MNLIVNTDGGSRGNPGPSAYAFIIKTTEGVILHQEADVLGRATNNIAEYMAVLKAFEYINKYLNKKAPHKVELICDSQLIAEQLKGNFKIKNEELKKTFERIKILEMEIGSISYRNVPRGENFIADKLVNKALDENGF